jgi:hypothetical protein
MCVFAVFAHFRFLTPGRTNEREITQKGRYGYCKLHYKFNPGQTGISREIQDPGSREGPGAADFKIDIIVTPTLFLVYQSTRGVYIIMSSLISNSVRNIIFV